VEGRKSRLFNRALRCDAQPESQFISSESDRTSSSTTVQTSLPKYSQTNQARLSMKRKSGDEQSPAAAPAKRSARAPASPYSPPTTGDDRQSAIKRCWSADDADMHEYHDEVWGRAETDESRLFESQTLQLMQCGVSWGTVWRKREHFRRAFKNYDVAKVAGIDAKGIDGMMAWPDGTIIRNRSKLRAVVQNAQLILSMRNAEASGSGVSFAQLLWSHCPANDKERLKTMQSVSGSHMRSEQVDSSSYETRDASDGVHPSKSVCALSRELKRCGFGFMGPTTVLSFMQVRRPVLPVRVCSDSLTVDAGHRPSQPPRS